MQKLARIVLVGSMATAGALFITAADCGGSNIVTCETDEDCADNAANPNATQCDTTTGTCEEPECTENIECQVTDGGATASCEANADCTEAGDVCVTGALGTAHCIATEDAAAPCASFNTVAATTDDVEGNSVTICVDDAISCTDGTCG